MAQGTDFVVGIIVKLKSGGPDMTIKKIVQNYNTNKPTGDVICQWFAGKGLQQGEFPVNSLELVEAEAKGA